MADIINRDTQNYDMERIRVAAEALGIDINQMQSSPEQRTATVNKLKNMLSQQRGEQLRSTTSGVLGNISDIYLQSAGIKPPQKERKSELDELIMYEKLKQAQQASEEKALKLEQAKRTAEYQRGLEERVRKPEVTPREITPEIPREPIPTGIPPIPTGVAEAPTTALPTMAEEQAPTPTITKITRKPDGTYEEKEVDNPAYEEFTKERQAEREVEKQVKAQEKKDILKSTQDFRNVNYKIGNTYDAWIKTVDDTFRETGVRPGVAGGTITTVRGITRMNPFYEGFKGGIVEYAAAVGRVAIPGSRSVRVIDIFKPTAPSTFSSIPSGIFNSAQSYTNAVATDMSRNYKDYEDDVAISGGEQEFLNEIKALTVAKFVQRVNAQNPDLIDDAEQKQIDKLLSGKTVEEVLTDFEQRQRIKRIYEIDKITRGQ